MPDTDAEKRRTLMINLIASWLYAICLLTAGFVALKIGSIFGLIPIIFGGLLFVAGATQARMLFDLDDREH